MNNILKLLKNYKTISIIGMDKNTGKTTTLNHILSEARGKVSLGLTSIGRDGEELDRVTATEKPKIYIENGTLIATAKQCLLNSDITKEIIETTGISTPMGEIIIVKALSDGYVDLGGPSLNTLIADINEKMMSLGSELIIVDGALGRKSFASPAITEAAILSTGASLSRSMSKVIEQTIHTVNLLTIENEKDEEILQKCRKLTDNCRVFIIYKDRSVKKLNVLTSLQAAKEIAEALNENEAMYLVVKGVISDKLLEDIMKLSDKYKGITLLAENGTKLFLSEDSIYKFNKQGGKIKVITPIKIACITCNPVSPYGYEFDKYKLLNGIKEKVDIPVFDVIGGGE